MEQQRNRCHKCNKGPNAVNADPLLTSDILEGSNGTTEAGDETDFRSAGVNWTSEGITTDDKIIIHSGTSVTTGVYAITAVGTTTLTISAGATTSASSVSFSIIKGSDFTLQAGSPAIDAGLDANDTGATV